MAIDPPPFLETPHDEQTKQVPLSWVAWFESIVTTVQDLTVSAAVWGSITGTLSNQTDLQNALDAKQDTIETYEFINRNLYAYDAGITYSGGNISSIVYSLGGGDTITKTFNYTGEDLTSVVLSGDTPAGIDLTKTLAYSSGELIGFSYS